MTEQTDYRLNHYVPVWYQKRFLAPGQGRYWYLDLHPEQLVSNGRRYTRRDLLHWGPNSCFAETDLYTVKWGNHENVDIEKFFFGRIDTSGRDAIDHVANISLQNFPPNESVTDLLEYMSVQKLRTPKGLGWLAKLAGGGVRNSILIALQELRQAHCATWCESIWQVASASQSPTKFIISDHPVTVYNRGCFPGSAQCVGFNDPDIRLAATHTYFPLSLDKVLILTNLSWVRNPYQKETTVRPNPRLFRRTIFNLLDIQLYRELTEQEVREINYITKKRALRYIAGAEKDWLYPERYLPSTHWNKLGGGLLLMPDPRNIYMGGEIMVGYKDGHAESWNEYGQRPWQKGYTDEARIEVEHASLQRFKAEFAALAGPTYRGTSMHFHMGDGPYITPAEFHQEDLEQAKRYRLAGKR